MIKHNCQVEHTLHFTKLLPFQGNLKQRSDKDIQDLAESLLVKGQIAPFYIWHKPCPIDHDKESWHKQQLNYILDGHARHLAIQRLAEDDPELLNHEYPVIFIVAETIEEAKDMLLEICSAYGRITSKGLATFVKDSPTIKLDKLGIKVKLPEARLSPIVQKPTTHAVLRLKIPLDKVEQVMNVLKDVSFVEIL